MCTDLPHWLGSPLPLAEELLARPPLPRALLSRMFALLGQLQEEADADPRPSQTGRLLSAPELELGRRIQQTRESKRRALT